jgi:hypothetical protein
VDLAFRDISDDVVRRANKIHKATALPETHMLPTNCIEHRDKAVQSSITYNLDPVLNPSSVSCALQDQATSFFFKTYVRAKSPFSRGQLDFLPFMYGQVQEDDTLRRVVKSIGMAGISTVIGNPQLMIVAKDNYVSALRLTNIALSSPATSFNDQTLITVLLLWLYEVGRPVHCSS